MSVAYRSRLLTGLALEHLFNPEADFRLATKNCSDLLLIEMFQVGSVGLRRQRKEFDFFHQRDSIFHIKLDKFPDLGLFRRFDVHVNEDRTGQWLIGAILHGLRGWDDGTLAAVNGDRFQLFLIFDIVGKAEKPEPVLVAGNALHQNVVILRRGKVAPARFSLADNGLGKIIESARVRASTVEFDWFVGPSRIHLIPSW